MKISYFSLTFLIAFLPALAPTFNTFNVEGKNETLKSNLQPETHVHHAGCSFQHDNHAIYSDQIQFGAELGKFIRESRIKDNNYKIKTVVIDPGHGGKDPGCSGKGTKEKVIALSLALQLGRTLKSHFPEVQFIFTRQSDVFIPLDRRAKIANENDADLFISIHCNNFPKSGTVKGSETYVLGLHRAQDNLEVAKRENSAIFYEENYQETYNGYDPNSAEGHIILSMFQNAFLEQSILFANKIESNIKKNTSHRSRGVRQAGFLVLRETTMPSVLVEAGYLSNAKDNKYLATKEGQAQVVNAIANAFSEYKSEVEGGTTTNIPLAYYAPAPVQQEFVAKSAPVTKTNKPKIIKSPAKMTAKGAKTTKSLEKIPSNSKISKQSLIIPTQIKGKTKQQPVATTNNMIQYKVVLASTSQLLNTDVSPWNSLPYSVQIIKDGDMYKYLASGFDSFDKALSAKNTLRKSGFKEAFVVAYENGKRIDMKVAKAKTGVGY